MLFCVSDELLSAPTVGARCFVKHLEQFDKSSDVNSELFVTLQLYHVVFIGHLSQLLMYIIPL